MTDPNSPAPVSLREVADAAGVSRMTASRALSGRGRVAAATQARVRRAAERLGYQPDPEVTKLMHHLRTRRTRRPAGVIVGLTTRQAADPEPYFRAMVHGATRRAEERGYRFEVLGIGEAPEPTLGRRLRNRGVEGLVLLPMAAPIDLSGLLDWAAFTTVAATTSVLAPAVDRVAPHHFANTLLLCQRLNGLGHRRLGLLLPREHDRRVQHTFAAACEWHARHHAGASASTLAYGVFSTEVVRNWWRREKPDAVLVHEVAAARQLRKALPSHGRRPLVIAVTSVVELTSPGCWGINERPDAIGAAALDHVADRIERRTRGLPAIPLTTLLAGLWVGPQATAGNAAAGMPRRDG